MYNQIDAKKKLEKNLKLPCEQYKPSLFSLCTLINVKHYSSSTTIVWLGLILYIYIYIYICMLGVFARTDQCNGGVQRSRQSL